MLPILGATTEFTKGEGVAFNHADKKLYYAMSYIQGSMKAKDGGPVDHIRLKENNAGATYTFDLAGGQKDTAGNPIDSDYVPVRAYVEPALAGAPDRARRLWQHRRSGSHRQHRQSVLFGKDAHAVHRRRFDDASEQLHLWPTTSIRKKLARILSVAAGAESTGLQVVEDLNGHAYIMANNQHQGDWIKTTPKELKERLEKKAGDQWGRNRHGVPNWRLESHVGYIGGLPAFK
jgi:hypothetical protein